MPIKFTSTLDITNNRITNLGTPTAAGDAVTKSYVDAVASGLVWKDAVRAAATTDIDLASPGAIDGVTLASGNRVLLMGQTDATENGIYTFSGGTLTRATDADSATELRPGSIATVSEGAGQGNKTYVLITDGPITIGSTALAWTLANNNTSPVYTSGDGVDVDSGTHEISAVADTAGGLSVGSGGISVRVGGGLVVDGSNNVSVSLATSDPGLKIVTNKLSVKIGEVSGLAFDDGGLIVEADPDHGMEITSNGVSAIQGAGIFIDSSGIAVSPKADSGVVVDGDGVSVKVDVTRGISVDADGLFVLVNADGGLTSDEDGLAVTVDPNGGLTSSEDGLAAVVNPDGGLSVNGDGLAILANLGITVDGGGVGVDTTVVVRRYTDTVGNGSDTTITVEHGLGSRFVGVEVFTTATPWETVFVGVTRPDENTVELDFGDNAPANNAYKVVVWGAADPIEI